MRYFKQGLIGILFFLFPFLAEGRGLDFSRVVTVLTQQVPAGEQPLGEERRGVTTGLLLPGGRYVLTVYPEVKKALFIEVVLPGGNSLAARFRAYDRFTELAFLELSRQVKERGRLIFARRLPSPGERVYLAFRPATLEVYPGWVVRAPLYLPFKGYLPREYLLVFTPARRSGPVFNAHGELCGFLVAQPDALRFGNVLVESARVISLAVSRFLKEGKIEWAWLGVETQPLTPSLARALDLPFQRGLLVTEVYPRSPARRAGLKGGRTPKAVGNRVYHVGGDIILSADGIPLERPGDLMAVVLSKRPGEILKLEIFRGGKKRYIAIKLSRRPES